MPIVRQYSMAISARETNDSATAGDRDDRPASAAKVSGDRKYDGFLDNVSVNSYPQYLAPEKIVSYSSPPSPSRSHSFPSVQVKKRTPLCTYVVEDIPNKKHNSINRYRYITNPPGWKLKTTTQHGEYILQKQSASPPKKSPYGTYIPGWRVVGVAAPHTTVDRNEPIFEKDEDDLQLPSGTLQSSSSSSFKPQSYNHFNALTEIVQKGQYI